MSEYSNNQQGLIILFLVMVLIVLLISAYKFYVYHKNAEALQDQIKQVISSSFTKYLDK